MKLLLFALGLIFLLSSPSKAAFIKSIIAEQGIESYSDGMQVAFLLKSFDRKHVEQLAGRKLSLAERLYLRLVQHRLSKKLKRESQTEGFNAGGFCLGFFLGLLGVLVAYLISDDDNLRKWSLIGLATAAVLGAILFLILLFALISHYYR